jgi:hypothetical protein
MIASLLGANPPPNLKAANEGKSLEDFLADPFPADCRHKFETRMVIAQTSDAEFTKSFEESLQVSRQKDVQWVLQFVPKSEISNYKMPKFKL